LFFWGKTKGVSSSANPFCYGADGIRTRDLLTARRQLVFIVFLGFYLFNFIWKTFLRGWFNFSLFLSILECLVYKKYTILNSLTTQIVSRNSDEKQGGDIESKKEK